MKLNHNPYRIFEKSQTPAGLYARKKWLGQHDDGFRRDFDAAVALLAAGRESAGAWRGSIQMTIRRLFGLHLTVRDATPTVDGSLEWMQREISQGGAAADPLFDDPRSFDGLPFVPGDRRIYPRCAFLFLSSVFGWGEDPSVREMYAELLCPQDPEAWLRNDPASLNNAMRALVVDEKHAAGEAVGAVVSVLAAHQDPGGAWSAGVPFCQTVNALAHLKSAEADAQLDRAFNRLGRTQNADGTWGRRQKEWNTFLVVHALRNKGRL